MERKRHNPTFLTMFILLVGVLSQNLVIPVICTTIEGQKTYYSPDPHAGSPPTGLSNSLCSTCPPTHGSGGGGHHHGHGHSHHGTPSHGGGGSYNPTPSPPSGSNCGSPPQVPYTPTPSTPSNPPSGGGGNYNSPPTYGSGSPPTPITLSPPTIPIDPGTPTIPSPPQVPYTPTPSVPTTPSTPSNPPSGGGGNYNSPPTYGSGSPPTPITLSPPTTPIDPGTPTIPSTPPYLPSPTPFTGTCNYWSTHPTIIWGLLGWWGSIGHVFGVSSMPGVGASLSLPEALSNTRTDGLGALYREGTASFLNSLVNNRFPYTTQQVRERFVASVGSNKAAAAQANLFRMANEGQMKPRA